MNKILIYSYLLSLTYLLSITVGCDRSDGGSQIADETHLSISKKEYQQKVYASWLGQIVGNTYGLSYEFKFIEEPGPDKFPYGYGWTLNELEKHNGAFSDDDTDIEYMYLTQMEEKGIEPGYFELAEAWKKHVKEKVWCANRAAVNLMHAGHYPPVTGSARFNTQWMQIDPQLVNEIWAVTAPGMIDYAVEKSAFMARITNDSFGIEPTLHYAAMYSAAFFEKDVVRLIDTGKKALPEGSRFGEVIERVIQLHRSYPETWQKARQVIKKELLVQADHNKYAWAPIDAQLNGALGILALLYGEGDFQKTLDFCCAFGMDADNQAATMCGLLGIINGPERIPHALLFPLKDHQWQKPFNDSYKMITREGLPDASLSEVAGRMAAQGEKIILANGGAITKKNGETYYRINAHAKFTAPFELNPVPTIHASVNQPFEYQIYTGAEQNGVALSLKGELPDGLNVSKNVLSGIIQKTGHYNFELEAANKGLKKRIDIQLMVHSENLAPSASTIIYNKRSKNHNIELIRDGNTAQSYYSEKANELQDLDFYGYIWDEPRKISAITYNNGIPSEYCGWFTSFDVEYLQGPEWKKIEKISIYPEMDLDNSQWRKPHLMDYHISFEPILSNGIRIIGLSGGIEKDAANAHLGLQYYTSISELSVYEE